jgi:glyoxylase-like metal-dependent hydrolase (beta-lactamase superfamily II)
MVTGDLSLAKPLRWFDDYYVVAELGDGAYAIGEPRYGQCNFSYLIVGSDRALLFDTGPGIRDQGRQGADFAADRRAVLPSAFRSRWKSQSFRGRRTSGLTGTSSTNARRPI